jgi:GT2 family glycosyltransferase
MMPLVYIVLVNYKGYQDTVECMESLKEINYNNYRLVVVDNASADGSYEKLKAEYKDHIIIESGDNMGFAGGNNIGIKLAIENNAEYVLLLNNDTIVHREFLLSMVNCFQSNKNVGIVGGKILYYDKRDIISHAGGYIDRFKYTTVHYGLNCHGEDPSFNVERAVGFISGCLMMIDCKMIKEIGLLAEDYFMYYEDTDYCARMSSAGYELRYTPKAKIYHKVSMSSGGEDSAFFLEWNTRNRRIFMERHKVGSGLGVRASTSASTSVEEIKFQLSKLYFYSTRYVRCIKYSLGGNTKKAKAILAGLKAGKEFIKASS